MGKALFKPNGPRFHFGFDYVRCRIAVNMCGLYWPTPGLITSNSTQVHVLLHLKSCEWMKVDPCGHLATNSCTADLSWSTARKRLLTPMVMPVQTRC